MLYLGNAVLKLIINYSFEEIIYKYKFSLFAEVDSLKELIKYLFRVLFFVFYRQKMRQFLLPQRRQLGPVRRRGRRGTPSHKRRNAHPSS
jgi:hypothetical protein